MKFFHRYNSTIHGNYRKAYLRCGLLTGLMLILYLLVRWLMRNPAESPISFLSDGILLVAVFLFTMLYRNALPERKATLKELMLFGMGTAIVACFLYGIYIWVSGYRRAEYEIHPVVRRIERIHEAVRRKSLLTSSLSDFWPHVHQAVQITFKWLEKRIIRLWSHKNHSLFCSGMGKRQAHTVKGNLIFAFRIAITMVAYQRMT